jgi:hypothetical protein
VKYSVYAGKPRALTTRRRGDKAATKATKATKAAATEEAAPADQTGGEAEKA